MEKKTLDIFIGVKIIVYGTGINAKSFIEKYKKHADIVCCLDKTRRDGYFCGVFIRDWDDIEPEEAECVVIAASDKSIRDIYFRITYNCDRNKLDIYDWRGVNLREIYRYEYIPYHVRPLLKNDKKIILKREIDAHEAISFDLFDTLIMRRTMEPEDVFRFVEARLDEGCPVKKDFFLLRKRCELQVNAVVHGFGKIYRQMERETGLGEHELDYIAQMEIACEKEVMLPRLGMVELLGYALSRGKKVNIVSDMYLDASILDNILHSLGIAGYENIFVSCEYGTSKGGELFDRYKEKVKAGSYLHIGDNQDADGESALRHGLDVFLIPSGIDLLRASSLRKILYYAKGDFNRRLIGECIAELFHDPFCFCGAISQVSVAKPSALARCFIAPIVYKYLEALKEEVKHRRYDKVLLGARDGYIFDRVIREVPLEVNPNDFQYTYISRALAFQLGMGHPAVDADYQNYLQVDSRRTIEDDQDFLAGKVSVPYKNTKDAYIAYLEGVGIYLSGKYLFCDLISGGTVQHSIQYMFSQGLDGFYLGRTFSYQHREMPVVSVFERGEIPNDQLLVDRLETFVVSSEATVLGMDAQGGFIFDDERRSEEELALLAEVQDEIVGGVRRIVEFASSCTGELDKMLAYTLLRGLGDVEPAGRLSQLKDWIYLDNNGERVRLFA